MLCQIPVLFLEKMRKRKQGNRTVDTKLLGIYNRNDFRLKGKVPIRMDKRELATNYFLEGYNCAQAVVLAFHEEAGLDREQAFRLPLPLAAAWAVCVRYAVRSAVCF